MRKYAIIFLASCFLGQFANASDFAMPDAGTLTDTLFNQLENDGTLNDLNDFESSQVKNSIKTQVNLNLAKVATGELSLDPTAPNYFLDFIKDAVGSIVGGIKKIASGIVSTVKKIGGKVFGFLKGPLGTVVSVGTGFLRLVDDTFLGEVIKNAIGAFSTLLSKFGPILSDFVSFIPIVGPALNIAFDAVLPWVDKVINADNISLVVKALITAGDTLGFTKEVVESVSDNQNKEAAGEIAPRTDPVHASRFLDMVSKAASKNEASNTDKAKLGTNFAKLCEGVLKYADTKKVSKLSEDTKLALAQCNFFADQVNQHAASKK